MEDELDKKLDKLNTGTRLSFGELGGKLKAIGQQINDLKGEPLQEKEIRSPSCNTNQKYIYEKNCRSNFR